MSNKFYIKFLAVFIIIIWVFLLVSCGNIVEINDHTILSAIAVDLIDDEVFIYAEMANIKSKNNENENGNNTDFMYVKAHGKTIPEARDNNDRQFDKPLYYSTVQLLMITENFAKERLVEYLYRLRSDESYRKKVKLVIVKEDPGKIFETINKKNKSVGFSSDSLLESLDKQGKSFSRSTIRILENISSDYTGILIPCLGLRDEELALIGFSVLNGTKVDGFIPIEESNGLIFLKAKNPVLTYIVPCNNVEYTIDVELKKRKIKSTFNNDKISFYMSLEFEAKLKYGNTKIPYNLDAVKIKEIEKTLKDTLQNEIVDTIDKSQKEFKCDYLQFDDEFRMKYPELYDEMDWANEFTKVEVNVNTTVHLIPDITMDYSP